MAADPSDRGGGDAEAERRDGGRRFERGVDGRECEWGRVLAWEPPGRVVLAWHIDGEWKYDPDPERASRIEVTFAADGGRTRVEPEHSRIERHAGWEKIVAAFDSPAGWQGIMDGFAARAA